jgi:hypothetical protein
MNTLVSGWGNALKDASGSYYIAGGGGGGTYNDGSFNVVSSGGLGGGGAGGMYNPITKQRIYPSNGITNTGGGGGGGSDSSGNSIVGGSGGSGLVVLRLDFGSGPIDSLSAITKTAMLNNGSTLSAGAFGVKLLYSAYIGPVMTIRRSSDSVIVDFYADNTGNLGTGYLGTGTSLSSWLNGSYAYVTKWWDQTGNQNHATQTTVGKIPIFDNVNKYVTFPTGCFFNLPNGAHPYSNSAYTYVFKCSITNVEGGVFGGGNIYTTNRQNAFRRYGNDYLNYWYGIAENQSNSSAYADNSVISVVYTGSIRYIYKNNVIIASLASSNRAQTNINNTIGSSGLNIEYMNGGYIQYMYIVPIAVSTADRNIMEAT